MSKIFVFVLVALSMGKVGMAHADVSVTCTYNLNYSIPYTDDSGNAQINQAMPSVPQDKLNGIPANTPSGACHLASCTQNGQPIWGC